MIKIIKMIINLEKLNKAIMFFLQIILFKSINLKLCKHENLAYPFYVSFGIKIVIIMTIKNYLMTYITIQFNRQDFSIF